MTTIHQSICSVIPPHMQRHIAQSGDESARIQVWSGVIQSISMPRCSPSAMLSARDIGPRTTHKDRRVFDAAGRELLPGKLLLDERHPDASNDPDAAKAFQACGHTYDFFANNYYRNSIDNHGMRLEATVHYGVEYVNACWNGRQLVIGDGDGRLFSGFAAFLDIIAHELTHGVIQYSARLPYAGQPGAVAEHLADAFGRMVKDWRLGLTAARSDWLIGAGVLLPAVKGTAIRSMMHPGTAYDDKVLGRDPQPGHMKDYDHSPRDNGGVHVNSGILNRAFALAAVGLGGFTWSVLGRIWYRVLTGKLTPELSFRSFARDTVRVAGELYGDGGTVQRTVADAWAEVGLPVPRTMLWSPQHRPSAPPVSSINNPQAK